MIICTISQEPDPDMDNRYRWVIPVEDPCHCIELHVGGVSTRAPCRPFSVKYFDSFMYSDDPEEIRKWLNCPGKCLTL